MYRNLVDPRPVQHLGGSHQDRIAVYFAGGGGSCTGFVMGLGRGPDYAINHNREALGMHRANHPEARQRCEDVMQVPPRECPGTTAAWFSPDCFPAGTLVLTATGYRAIETVKRGDMVLTHNNRWRAVTATMHAERELLSIRGYGHPGLQVSAEHPFYTRQCSRKWNQERNGYDRVLASPTWQKAGELSRSSYWGTPQCFPVLSMPVVEGRGMRMDERLMWLAGRYLGDGWMRRTSTRAELVITCGKHEVDSLRTLLARWPREGDRAQFNELEWHERATATAYQFATDHLGLVEWLRTNFGHRAEAKGIPAWALGMPLAWRESLLAGYVSADGHTTSEFVEIVTVSKALAFGVKSLVNSVGKMATVYFRDTNGSGKIQGREINARPCWRVRWRHQVSPAHSQIERRGGVDWGAVKEVTKLNKVARVYNLSVEEDESYVADSIIVHNCTHFSKARGGTPVSKQIRGLILVMLRWAKAKTKVMFMENVEEITSWGPVVQMCKGGKIGWYPDPQHAGRTWQAFLDAMRDGLAPDHPDMLFMLEALAGVDIADAAKHLELEVSDPRVMTYLEKKAEVSRRDLIRGFKYAVEYRELKAYEYGVPTTRKRLYGIFRCDGKPIVWPKPTHANPAHLVPGDTRQPWRTIAECIDWSLFCPSIFLTAQEAKELERTHGYKCKRPLVDNTLRRTARGVGRYILHAASPFVVNLTHHGGDRLEDVHGPFNTITAAQRGEKALVMGVVTEHANASNQRCMSADQPMRTQCAEIKGGHFALIAPTVINTANGKWDDAPSRTIDPQSPLPVQTGTQKFATVAGTLVHTAHGEQDKAGNKRRGRGARSVHEPAPTGTTSNDAAVVAATLVQTGYGERAGQEPRAMSVQAPLNTIVAGGGKHALAVSSMIKMRGTNLGDQVDKPLHAITAGGQHHGVVMASVVRPFGQSVGQACDAPAPVVMPGGGGKVGIVTGTVIQQNGGFNTVDARPADTPISAITTTGSQQMLAEVHLAHLDVYYGTEADGAPMDEPAPTARTTSHMSAVETTAAYPPLTEEQLLGARRVAAFLRQYGVEFEGEFAQVGDYVLVDIGLRMLTPRELFRAQGFPEDYVIDYAIMKNPKTGNMELRRLTKSEQIRMCGNAVCPGVAAAIIEANLPHLVRKKNPAPWRQDWLRLLKRAA